MHKFLMMMDATQCQAAPQAPQLRALLPGLRRLRRHAVLSFVPRAHADSAAGAERLAGLDELWIDTDAQPRAWQDLRGAYAALQVCSVTEQTIFERALAAPAPVHRLSLLQRRAGLSRADFCTYWQSVHAPLAHCHRHVARYVQNHVDAEADPSPAALHFDGMAEFEIADWDGMLADYATPEGARMRADVAHFARTVTTCVVRTQETATAA